MAHLGLARGLLYQDRLRNVLLPPRETFCWTDACRNGRACTRFFDTSSGPGIHEGMRRLIICALVFASTLALAGTTSFGAGRVRSAAANDELLTSVGIDVAKVTMRLPCYASSTPAGDTPEFFFCVYVQDEHELNLYSMDGDYLALEVTLKVRKIEGIAMQESRW